MDMALRDQFLQLWAKYFGQADLPITFYYTDHPRQRPLPPAAGWTCVMGQIARVCRGETLCLDRDSIGCFGGKRYLGFSQELMPGFEHFLSRGIPGKVEGERYKKTPEIVLEFMKHQPQFKAPARYVLFTRWDQLTAEDQPDVVIFFAPPDVLSGLFTLAGFEESDPQAVIAPFAAGCGTIIQHPYAQKDQEHPKSVLGSFDVSARPFVPAGTLSFATPFKKFQRMVRDMDESFLITPSWAKVQRRVAKSADPSA